MRVRTSRLQFGAAQKEDPSSRMIEGRKVGVRALNHVTLIFLTLFCLEAPSKARMVPALVFESAPQGALASYLFRPPVSPATCQFASRGARTSG